MDNSALPPLQRQYRSRSQQLEMELLGESWPLKWSPLPTTRIQDLCRQLLRLSLQPRDWQEAIAALRDCMAARLPCLVQVAPIECLQDP